MCKLRNPVDVWKNPVQALLKPGKQLPFEEAHGDFGPINDKAPAGPATLPTGPAVAPPASLSSAEALQSQQDLRQQELMRKSIKKTIYAGDTGGFRPAMTKP